MLSDRANLREIEGSNRASLGHHSRVGSTTSRRESRKRVLEEDLLTKDVTSTSVFCIRCERTIRLMPPYYPHNWVEHKKRAHSPPSLSDSDVEAEIVIIEDEAVDLDRLAGITLRSRK